MHLPKKIMSIAMSVAMVASFSFPTLAMATTDDETEEATLEEIEQAIENGSAGTYFPDGVTIDEASGDVVSSGGSDASTNSSAGTISTMSTSTSKNATGTANDNYKISSFSGLSRYYTCYDIAWKAFPSGSPNKVAIVVSGEDTAWADSLSASALAGALDCPLFISESNYFTDGTRINMKAMGVTKVIMIGGTDSLSSTVERSIESNGMTVTRLAGDTRYDTQMAIYDYGVENGLWNSSSIIAASGANYPDALSASPVSYSQKFPIFLIDPSNSLTSEQTSALKSSSVKNVYVMGGTASVSASDASALKTATGGTVQRIAGDTRYTTSGEIAKWAVSKGYLNWNYTAFASGSKPTDALCGSTLQGRIGSCLLLVDINQDEAISYAAGKGITHVRVFGGNASVRPATRNDIAYTLGFKLNDIQGFKVYVDAGHGPGNASRYATALDPGATLKDSNGRVVYAEYTYTKKVADNIAARLDAAGIDYFLNDDGGYYGLRHTEAVVNDCNVVISIHFNAGGGSGSLSLIHEYNACQWSSKVQNIMHPYLLQGTGLSNLGKKTQEVAILSGQLPAVLLEVCFIDNYSDMSKFLSRESYVEQCITTGIESL